MQHNYLKGTTFIILSAVFFAFMGASVKLAGDIPTIQKVFFRNIITFVVSFIVIVYNKKKISGSKENHYFLILRSLFGLTGIFFYFYSISNLPLADSTIINKLSPFFVTLFAFLFLNEKITFFKILTLIMAFSGALLIIKPGFNLNLIPALSGVLSASLAAAGYTVVRFISNKEDPFVIVLYFSGISSIISLPLMMTNFIVPDITQASGLILAGVFATGAQFFLTYGYKYSHASDLAIFNYFSIPFAALLGFFIWKEIPDLFTLLGAIIIFISAALLYLSIKKNNTKTTIS